MDNLVWLPYVAIMLGVFCRAIIPWLRELQSNPDVGWDWRYLRGQLIGAVMVVLALPLLIDLQNASNWSFLPAWLSGWAAADIGRMFDKTITGHGRD
jgi:hypothetical protein